MPVETAPSITSSVAALKSAATQEKLPEPLEIAGPIEANSISINPWIICLRSAIPNQSNRPTYSAFFKDGKFVSVTASSIVDGCEKQMFRPLN
jgi:hypothetical protein